MILGDMQMEKMLIWEVLVAFRTTVCVFFLVVHIVLFERGKLQWLVGWE
jgi:hypothetical protein